MAFVFNIEEASTCMHIALKDPDEMTFDGYDGIAEHMDGDCGSEVDTILSEYADTSVEATEVSSAIEGTIKEHLRAVGVSDDQTDEVWKAIENKFWSEYKDKTGVEFEL